MIIDLFAGGGGASQGIEDALGVVPVWMAFRCLYCGEYFNQREAEEHFGKTRAEWEKLNERNR
jgi:site-specific DNA-cytosine methylase